MKLNKCKLIILKNRQLIRFKPKQKFQNINKAFTKQELLVLVSILVLLSFIIKQHFYFGFFGIFLLLVCMVIIKPKWYTIILYVTISFSFIMLCLYFSDGLTFNGLQKIIRNNNSFFYLRNLLFLWLKEHLNSEKWYGFILLTVFNFKNTINIGLLNKFHFLGISYLFVISGLHLNFLFFLINILFFKKMPRIQIFIQFFILFFYGYFLSYSLSVFRIILQRLINLFFKDYQKSHYLSALCLILVFHQIGLNYAYLITFICVFSILEIVNLQINSFLKVIVITFICNVLTIPLIIKISSQYNYLSFLFGLLLSPIATLYYLVNLFTFWIIWFENVQILIFNGFLTLVESLIVWNTIFLIYKINDFIFLFTYLIIIMSFTIWKYKNF